MVAGDFLGSIPVGANAYVLKSIIHDWPDDKARTILQVCRRALSMGGKLLLVEGGLPVLALASADRLKLQTHQH
jgi:hypothetical protein